MFNHRRLLALAATLALTLTGCGSTSVVVVPEVTERPTPRPTPDPWPAVFEARLCQAINAFPSVQKELAQLTDAANEADAAGVSVYAFTTKTAIEEVDADLKAIASHYKPARGMLVSWRGMNRVLIEALTLIEDGADTGSTSKLSKGTKRLLEGTKLINAATHELEDFAAETGFVCS